MPVEFSVTLQDRPGTLVRLGQMLGEAAVNIEAIQGTSREGHAFVRFVPRDPQQASAMIGRPVREPRTGLPGFGRTEMSVDSSFDNLIRSQQQRRRDRQAEGLRGLKVDDEFDRPCLLDG